jgi:hypothetical protein
MISEYKQAVHKNIADVKDNFSYLLRPLTIVIQTLCSSASPFFRYFTAIASSCSFKESTLSLTEALEEQLRALKQAFQGVADLGDALKGKGADNIKDFFQGQAEIADSWLTLVSAQIAFLNGISGDIKDQELSDTYVETSFLEHELPNADLKASEIVSAHKAEIDSIF